ncbi:helix-turn-helix domain-containing protein [Bacillus sp. FJAT-28004]|uniref:helix-turn-helix domain-containing protein n=1 Tax=Bacillus sp. FJAT-28004 TaxID=1679165 RepID=UPI0006B53E12|nr:AraC family transcriptional regulator [Bacillus sp. FJAT-28004]
MNFQSAILKTPIVPYVREADHAVRKPWFIPERRLLDYLLVYIQEGECLFEVEGINVELHRGDFCLIQPNCYHTLRGITDTVTPYAHMDFFFSPRREDSFPSPVGLIDLDAYKDLIQPCLNDFNDIYIPVKFKPTEPIRFRDILFNMIGIWQNPSAYNSLEVQHLGTELVMMLLQDFYPTYRKPHAAPNVFSWMTSYLSLHISEPLTVEKMAARAQLSPSRFSALFREHFHTSPHQYLLQFRIGHAVHLLSRTGLSMTEIADYCGFANVHHFSRVFKKVTGRTPGSTRSNESS